jgi:phosphoribosyl-ATP pyrophosphohydrolase
MGKTAKKSAGALDVSGGMLAVPGIGKKSSVKKGEAKKTALKKTGIKKADVKKAGVKKAGGKKANPKKRIAPAPAPAAPPPPLAVGASSAVLDRLWVVISNRRGADPAVSHSARLLSRGTAKVAQKFGEEAVECVIEAVGGTRQALIAESADVLYHLVVMWVNAGIRADEVWAELARREGVSGVAEKASRARALPIERGIGTTKIP